MTTPKNNSAMTSATVWAGGAAAANETALCRQFVSNPMPAGVVFLLTDTIKCQIRCSQSAANDNINRTPMCLKVIDQSGGSVQATLKALGAYGPNTTEWSTSLRNKTLADGDVLDATYTTGVGEYLVLEVGGQVDGTGGTSVTGTMSFGSASATDLAQNETETTANNSWFEISTDITFLDLSVDCTQTSRLGLIAVTDLEGSSYVDPQFVVHLGGLYDTGKNYRPAAIDAVMPTVTAVSGEIGVALMGGSTISIIGDELLPESNRDPRKAAEVTWANGGISGKRTDEWADSGDGAWTTFATRLTNAGLTGSQLRVVFFSDYANAGLQTFEGEVEQNNIWTEAVVANIIAAYPSVQIVYLCAHHYVGYAGLGLSVMEPDNYWNAWTHQRVIAGRSGTASPWTVAGPYLWCNGIGPNSNGLEVICLDFEQSSGSAGVHMETSGAKKETRVFLNFLHHDQSARWYRATG